MNHRPDATRRTTLFLLAIAASLGCHTAGTSQSTTTPIAGQGSDQQFDLVVYGFDFDPGEHEIFLRTNLDFGAEWVSLGTLDAAPPRGSSGNAWAAAVFPDLSTERFLGQDFREHYLDVRVVTRGDSDGSSVTAFYAVPHIPGAPNVAAEIRRLIEEQPLAVEHHSLASHVQPRPQPLEPGVEYVEHVRAPMKHTLPGVMEVEQLKVEWRHRGQ